MSFFHIAILALVQGLCELLPVSSSAHVIVAERLLGLDPTAPEMTLLLVMLHTGTMFAVILYFWSQWKTTYLKRGDDSRRQLVMVVLATLATGVVGLALLKIIPRVIGAGSKFEIEHLFGNPTLIAVSLLAAGVLILFSGLREKRRAGHRDVSAGSALAIGVVQGLCLPFRGFSRSGATISTGLLMSVSRARAEEFSFALAVVLTPAVIVREGLRAVHAGVASAAAGGWANLVVPSLVGMVFSFIAGLAALRWLSGWLENGRWHYFGLYCLVASAFVFLTQVMGA
ncbi:MAG: undecaprenyl-diphosphate phosphatase [Burkholderiales bacterium]|nr:undecaprenyl-diphosphate phosphatase [Burkholderiales bacterium]